MSWSPWSGSRRSFASSFRSVSSVNRDGKMHGGRERPRAHDPRSRPPQAGSDPRDRRGGELWDRDLILSAAAELASLTLLHYDSDFETIARITGQPMEWVVARGSVPWFVGS
jgi:hypothetical protein